MDKIWGNIFDGEIMTSINIDNSTKIVFFQAFVLSSVSLATCLLIHMSFLSPHRGQGTLHANI